MLTLEGSAFTNCDQQTRRGFLKVGALGLGGLTLPNLLRARAEQPTASTQKDTAVILLFLAGGPSHIDMYDLKPNAPAEYRGEFKTIQTNVPGIDISEHLPLHAKIMDKLAVVRSVTHTHPGHGGGPHWVMTGYNPVVEITDNHYPSIGSIVSKVRGPNKPGMPAYVCTHRSVNSGAAAYLGVEHNPFVPGNDPNSASFQVRDIQVPSSVDASRLDRRRDLLKTVDQMRRDVDASGVANGFDKFYAEAYEMVTSKAAVEAFNIHKEDPKLRDMYGRNTFGQSCLLARRLVESGVTFVGVQTHMGWDTHGNNFKQLKDTLLPFYDRAFTALVSDLHDRGLNKKVMVLVTGDFGRTPKINKDSGRDHWPGAMSVPFAGGGLQVGQVIGSTDARAEYPKEKPYGPQDVLATAYHFLGIDYSQSFLNEAQRPIRICDVGKAIPELIG